MKKIVCLFGIVFMLLVGTWSQTKEDNIRTLMALSGSGDLEIQILDTLIPQFSQMLPEVPAEFWTSFRKKVNTDELIEKVIPIYSKYYTDDDIKQLIEFYKTPIGQKLAKVSPLIMQDSMSVGQEWGMKIGEEIIKELTVKGYSF